MSWDKPDLYYQPGYFGLTIVGEVEWEKPCYSFDKTVVWYHNDSGKFYFASDCGCSCPSPFEDFTSLDDAESGDKWDAISYVQRNKYRSYTVEDRNYSTPQVANLCSRILDYGDG